MMEGEVMCEAPERLGGVLCGGEGGGVCGCWGSLRRDGWV